jgi:hypothetical protein
LVTGEPRFVEVWLDVFGGDGDDSGDDVVMIE